MSKQGVKSVQFRIKVNFVVVTWVDMALFNSSSFFKCSWNFIVKLQVLGLRLGVDFTFTLDNNNDDNNNENDNDNNNNPHLNFFKGSVLGVKEQGLGIRDKG